MKVATVLLSSEPISMVRRHRGMISVDSRKLMTSVSSTWRKQGAAARHDVSPPHAHERECVCVSHALRWVLRTLTSAPMTPSEVRRRYSNGRVLDTVLRKGYRNRGMWAARHNNTRARQGNAALRRRALNPLLFRAGAPAAALPSPGPTP